MRALNWEYCECGCHGHELNIGHVHLWLFDDLKGTLYLRKGHGHVSPLVDKFKTWKKVDKAARKILTKELKSVADAYKEING